MSSYDCVLTIDFDCFENTLLPDALRVLAGKIGIREFASAYIPKPDEDFIHEYCLNGNYVCVPEYIALFHAPLSEWKSNEIIATSAYEKQRKCERELAEKSEWLLPCWDTIFTEAVKQTCAIELPDEDSIDDTHDGYYSRLHDFPEVQVAGAKNGWRFLNIFYEGVWLRDKSLYLQKRRHASPEKLFDLCEKLFFGTHCLPALHHRSMFPSWTAYDDTEICGFMTPPEVKDLATFIVEIRAVAPKDDELFLLFADRLERSAKVGAGLITIQGGL